MIAGRTIQSFLFFGEPFAGRRQVHCIHAAPERERGGGGG